MKTLLTAIVIAAMFGVSRQAFAQNETAMKNTNKNANAVNTERKMNHKGESRKTGFRNVVGRVVDTRGVSLNGVRGKHRLLKVETPQGRRVVVDMGETSKLGNSNIAKGDRIFASGKAARIGGKPVVYARYVGELQPVGASGFKK